MKKLKKLIKKLNKHGFEVSFIRKIDRLNYLIFDNKKKELDGYEIQIYSLTNGNSYFFNLDFNSDTIYIYYMPETLYISALDISMIDTIIYVLEKAIKKIYKNYSVKLGIQ